MSWPWAPAAWGWPPTPSPSCPASCPRVDEVARAKSDPAGGVQLADIQEARRRIAGVARRTPVLSSPSLDAALGCTVLLKAENLQRTGSFKVRGAVNKIACLLAKERRRGVVAASAGNHAQGVALAAQAAGCRAVIVMPRHASLAKVTATRGYGAEVLLHGESFDEAQARALELSQAEGLIFIPAFDDAAIVAGQGTIGLEIMEDVPQADAVLVPAGGGGLIAGVAVALKESGCRAEVIGVQAAAAPALSQSLAAGRLKPVKAHSTVADGIAVGHPGQLPFQLVRRHVDRILTVDDEVITQAMVLLLERAKLLVEGAGAVGIAALLGGLREYRGRRVVAVLSGGNIDSNLIARVLEHGLAHAGRYLVLRVVVQDQPGRLARLLEGIAQADVNVLEVAHRRAATHLPIGVVEVEVVVETRDAAHGEEVCAHLERQGYSQGAPGPGPFGVPVRYFTSKEAEWRQQLTAPAPAP
ncbi:MAG: threonine ammonia-lyase [Chloroflexi bacterium]|nr:threonine ammonia-lyase [Chloroflexota bacterium]